MIKPSLFLVSLVIACAALLCASLSVHAQSKPFTVRELHILKKVGAPSVSPSGKYAVYSVSRWNADTKKSSSHIELLDISTGIALPATQESEGISDFNPMFTPDGKWVIFLSNRGDAGVQAFYFSLNNLEVTPLTKLPVSLDNMKVSPDGKFITFTVEVYVDCDNLDCTARRDKEQEDKGANTGIVFDKLFVRHWDRYVMPGKYAHIFMLPILINDSGIQVNGNARDLMNGMPSNSPVPPFGGAEQYDISPDGHEVAFTSENAKTSSVAWTTGWDVMTVKTDDPSSIPQCITSFTQARTQQPAYSPNGKYIAYLSMDRPGLESDRLHVNLYDRSANSSVSITDAIDISFSELTWLNNSLSLLATADSDGHHKLYKIDIPQGSSSTKLFTLIDSDQNSGALQVPKSNDVILSRNSFYSPSEVWKISLIDDTGFGLKQITHYNTDFLSQFSFPQAESFYFNGANDTKVQGWLIRPIDFDASKTYPLAYLIHGGPEGAWGSSWSYRWNPQLWANRGYVVVMVNPRGSTGFGQKFTDGVRGHWGSTPFVDLMNGVDYVVQNYKFVDGNRACACGASFGGYSINWINGQNVGKFKCLVNHDGVFDTLAMAYGTEELWFTEAEFGGTPYENPENFEKYNPRNHVNTMNTPTLIIHGGHDFRIPISEGLSVFNALQRRGVPSKLIVFPMENHWVLKQENSILWYDTVLEWLDQWTHNST